MKLSNTLKAAFIAVFLCLGGCSTIETLGDYVRENPVFASVASRQAVAAFISTGETEAEQQEKARQVNSTISKALIYLDGDPKATVDTLMDMVANEIDWDDLTIQERFLVKDIMTLVEFELRKYEVQNSPFTDETKIAIRGLFETAASAAAIYLAK